jgi:2-polyprenyl-3-methyl-5-hydroxy-6-metoxy-1,4-benzoquinol methylase
MKCRFCKTPLEHVVIDLINSPASNSFLKEDELDSPETYYPLKVFVCDSCYLVQLDEFKKSDDIFNDEYVYFSSYSTSWLKHAKEYTEEMVQRFAYDKNSQVIEVASNDGYLLQYFKEKDIPVLGIEPTANTAKVAKEKGIESVIDFFGERLANDLVVQNKKADLLLGNNVLAHVPDILDFVGGMKIILKPEGVVTMEFPHLLQMVENNQFDTIYHEHFSYLSLYAVKQIFEACGLKIFDVTELPTHGGSLRIFACHANDESKSVSKNVEELMQREIQTGINTLEYYKRFQENAFNIKLNLLNFLISKKREGMKVAAYGAAAKGNTLLNYCGLKNDLIDFVVDANPHKQNKFLPGSHIPVVSEKSIKEVKPDFILIFPWNIKSEVTKQLKYVSDWGCKFVVAIPNLQEL